MVPELVFKKNQEIDGQPESSARVAESLENTFWVANRSASHYCD